MSIKDVLASPVMNEQTETERKIKNNLIAFSFISIFLYYGGLTISSESTILGLRFDGLTQDKIHLGFFVLVLYSLMHYLWYIRDGFTNWRLRLTAVKEMKSGTWGSLYSVPELDDKRNNTLYNWWVWHEKTFTDRLFVNDALIACIKDIEDVYLSRKVDLGYVENVDMLCSHLSSASAAFNNSCSDTTELVKLLTNTPFSDALPNFNSSFRSFLISQNLRWLIFECCIPFGLAALSLFSLFPTVLKLFSDHF